MTSNAQEHFRLGDLLMKAGVLSSDFIKEALINFEEEGLPLGKVLVLSGQLTERQLRYTLDLQYMVNDRLLDPEDTVAVLKVCLEQNLSLEDAFVESGIVQPEHQETNKLGQILLDSKLISNQILEECLESNKSTSLPLGHILCHRGYISQELVDRALAVQQFIRKGQLLRKQGIDSLVAAADRQKRLQELDCNKGYRQKPGKSTPLLGELLVTTNLCAERQIREWLLESLVGAMPLGVTILASRVLPEQCILAAVDIQEMLDNGTVTADQAHNSLVDIRANGTIPIRAVAEAGTIKERSNLARLLVELLTSCGIIKRAQLSTEARERLEVNYNQISYVCKEVLDNELADEKILYSALRAVDLINKGFIDKQKAIVSLEFSHKSSTTLEETLYMTGVTDRTRLKE